ncbi:hypothetical protein KSP39_PZI002934 [Platanthera zijinensis]|uniref:F-box domain-containing protein n=1 Tax=Platanthera zijinensis TaxID=2320716 RepID=A0AAP0GDY0_9ASPA
MEILAGGKCEEMEIAGRKWEEMEMDCLVCIFSKLNLDDLAVSVPYVCRSWSAAARDPLCWRFLDFRSLDFMPWSRFAKRFADRNSVSRFSFAGFMKLAVRRSAGLADELRLPELASIDDLILASNECPRLTALGLPNLNSDSKARIPELISKWKELKTLAMESKPSKFSQLAYEIAANCKNFKKLVMPTSSINREDASAIVKCLPNIRFLDMSRSFLVKEELLFILEGCRELSRLSAKNCVGFEASDGEVRSRGRRIKIFEVEGSKMDDDGWFEINERDDLQYVHVI